MPRSISRLYLPSSGNPIRLSPATMSAPINEATDGSVITARTPFIPRASAVTFLRSRNAGVYGKAPIDVQSTPKRVWSMVTFAETYIVSALTPSSPIIRFISAISAF